MRLRSAAVACEGEPFRGGAALESQDHAPLTVLVGHGLDRSAQHREAVVLDRHGSQRILPVRIEAGGDQHQLGFVGMGDRQQRFGEDRGVVRVAAAGRERRIDREAGARAGARLPLAAGAGIERPLVGADKEQPIGCVKGVLRSVAVVHVPVDAEHARQPASVGFRGGDGDVVEEAEAHRARRDCVVPGRADQGEGGAGFAVHDEAHAFRRGSGGEQRGIDRCARDSGVAVEGAGPPAQAEDGLHVARIVNARQLVQRRLRRIDQLRSPHRVLRQHAQDRAQPLGLFGVPVARVVLDAERVGQQRNGHGLPL
jgi:hypothetical protein